MKKILFLVCFIAILMFIGKTAFAQNNNPDSLKDALAGYTNPMERFSATIKYLEAIDSRAGNNVDSAICIDLLQVAQQLKNNNLSSYN